MVYKLQCLCRTTNTCIHIFKWEEVWGNIKWFFSRFLRRKIVVFEVMGLLYIPREFLQQHLILQCVECDWRLCRAKKKKKKDSICIPRQRKIYFHHLVKELLGKLNMAKIKVCVWEKATLLPRHPPFTLIFPLWRHECKEGCG